MPGLEAKNLSRAVVPGVGAILRDRIGACRRHPLCWGGERQSGAKPADMADYYAVLMRKIRETGDDPAKMREVVYEAARLALRWQVQEQWPRMDSSQSRRHISALEEAITRVEATATSSDRPAIREPGDAPAGPREMSQSHNAVDELPQGDTPEDAGRQPPGQPLFGNAGWQPPGQPSAELAGLEAVARILEGWGGLGKAPAALHESPQGCEAPIAAQKGAARETDEQPHSQRADSVPAKRPDATTPSCAGERKSSEAEPALHRGGQRRDPPIVSKKGEAPDADEAPRPSSRSLPPPKASNFDSDAAPPGGRINGEPDQTTGGHRANGLSRAAPVRDEASAHATVEQLSSRQRGPSKAKQADPMVDAEHPGRRINPKQKEAAAGTRARPLSVNEPVEHEKEDDASKTAEELHSRERKPSLAIGMNLDVDAERTGRGSNREKRNAEVFLQGSPQGHNAPFEPETDDFHETVEVLYPRNPLLAGHADTIASRELVLVPDRARRGAYLVNPADYVNPDVSYRLPSAPRSRARMVISGLMIAFQLVIAALAVAAFYIAMWGRSSPVLTAKEISGQASIEGPITMPERIAEAMTAVAAAPLTVAPGAAALSFPRPTVYGVYAIDDNRLIELEQVQGTPVDPRTRSQLQITKPGHIVIDAAKLAFIVFRRDLVSNAPDKVPVRIASRIAHSMIFDTAGKPVVTTPAIATWLIRDKGFDLRVSPVRENAEMVMLRPENPEFSFPSGRYELMLGGQAYDFVVAGEVTDPAHCVEGVATARGPVFYECKSP